MLAGRKPVAIFSRELDAPKYELGDEEFESYVESGRIFRRVVREDRIEHRYYYLPTEEWRVNLFELVRQSNPNNFNEDDLHRLDGVLLGYAKSDVERFITRIHRLKAGKSK